MPESPPVVTEIDYKKICEEIFMESLKLGFDNEVAAIDVMNSYPKLDNTQLLKYHGDLLKLQERLTKLKINLQHSNFQSSTHKSDLEEIDRVLGLMDKFYFASIKETLKKRGLTS